MSQLTLFPRIVIGTLVLATAALAAESFEQVPRQDPALRLWYTQPAADWNEALPLGNGRIGAMVFGGPERERLQLNEETIWTGAPGKEDDYRCDGPQRLPEIRKLVFEDKWSEAQALFGEAMVQNRWFSKYQPMCDLWIEFPGHEKPSDYRRELSLETAVATVTYRIGDVTFRRETFISPVDQVLVVKLSADKPGAVSFTTHLAGVLDFGRAYTGGGGVSSPDSDKATVIGDIRTEAGQRGEVVLHGKVTSGVIAYQSRLRVIPVGSTTRMDGDRMHVEGADSAVLLLAAGTNFRSYKDVTADPQSAIVRQLTEAAKKDYATMRAAHVKEHQRLFGRVSLTLPPSASSDLPTDRRLTKMCEGQDDPALAALLFQFGRYLVISSSRPGTRPPNLQGIWCGEANPAWDSKYTSNINLQMTLMRSSAEFFLDTLQEHPGHGYLVTCPSSSPENRHHKMKGKECAYQPSICAGPTMDMQILREQFEACAAAAKELGVDAEFAEQMAGVRARLAPTPVGCYGQIQEWLEDWDDPEDGHRHVSQLYGLYPGSEINPDITLDLVRAARVTLKHRGLASTGWSTAWKIAYLARIRDGETANRIVQYLLNFRPIRKEDQGEGAARGGVYPNMFSMCPPMQIDANFGATAGIAEMLLQSHARELHLLPAIPKSWSSGEVKGLCARGGFEVDITWNDGRLAQAVVRSKLGKPCVVRYGDKQARFQTQGGRSYVIGHSGEPVLGNRCQPFFTNCDGKPLNGDNVEVFTFPYKPKTVKYFWSVTRYSLLTRNTLPGKNDLFHAYNTKPDAEGNITVTFSVEDPKDGTYWMPVNAGEPYYFIVRYYGPDLDDLPPRPCNARPSGFPTSAAEVTKPVDGAVMHKEFSGSTMAFPPATAGTGQPTMPIGGLTISCVPVRPDRICSITGPPRLNTSTQIMIPEALYIRCYWGEKAVLDGTWKPPRIEQVK